MTDDAPTTFSTDDINQILSDSDVQQRLLALDEAQTTWEKLRYLEVPKMPCPECSGSGSVSAGSLGDICLGCNGSRVVDQPGVDEFTPPPFLELRKALVGYANALADREIPAMLPAGGFDAAGKPMAERPHPGKRNLALPATAGLPTLEQIQQLNTDGIARARALKAAPGVVDQRMLTAPKPQKGLRGEGDLGEYTDAELDDMEKDDESDDSPAGRRANREGVSASSKRKK